MRRGGVNYSILRFASKLFNSSMMLAFNDVGLLPPGRAPGGGGGAPGGLPIPGGMPIPGGIPIPGGGGAPIPGGIPAPWLIPGGIGAPAPPPAGTELSLALIASICCCRPEICWFIIVGSFSATIDDKASNVSMTR